MDTLETKFNLARVFRDSGRKEEAKALYKKFYDRTEEEVYELLSSDCTYNDYNKKRQIIIIVSSIIVLLAIVFLLVWFLIFIY